MKNIINDIIVVEGKSDACLISSFVDAEIIVTNGYECSTDLLEYLNKASVFKNIIVLTDPDDAGSKIRNTIRNSVPNVIDLHADIKQCNKHQKHGIAESNIEYLNDLLCKYYRTNKNDVYFTKTNLNELLDQGLSIKQISKLYKLGDVSSKVLVQRLNTLQITKESILKEIKNAN